MEVNFVIFFQLLQHLQLHPLVHLNHPQPHLHPRRQLLPLHRQSQLPQPPLLPLLWEVEVSLHPRPHLLPHQAVVEEALEVAPLHHRLLLPN